MKQLVLVVTGCLAGLLTFAQLKHDSIGKTGKGTTPAERYKKPTTANLPEGTYAKDNKVYIKQGYKAVYDASKKKAAIARINAGGGTGTTAISGGFACGCTEGTDDCVLIISGNSLACHSKGKCKSCSLIITIDTPQVVMMMAGNPDPSNMNWKRIEIPKMQQ